MRKFGRLLPPDFTHMTKYPVLSSMAPPPVVERKLSLPANYQSHYNQGNTNGCVGASCSIAMAILNYGDIYDWAWLWQNAKDYDYIWSTKRGDDQGTTVNGAMRVLRNLGHVEIDPILKMPAKPHKDDGIAEYRWDHTHQGIFWSISKGVPVIVATAWHMSMDYPTMKDGEYMIGLAEDIGPIEGSHAYCIVGASTSKKLVYIAQSWGRDWPELVGMPTAFLDKLLANQGEVALITDRPTR
jgi:hypothetical protein